MNIFCFEKTTESTSERYPIQTFYSSMHSEFEQKYEFKHRYRKIIYSFKHLIFGFFPSGVKGAIRSYLSKH